MPEPTLALDIGGTKIAAGLVDAKGRLLFETRQPTPHVADPGQVWAAAEQAVADALAQMASVRAVGISSAGPIHIGSGTISPVNIPAWRDFPIVDRVASVVRGVPVRLAGDGLCMALGEHRFGAGRGTAFMLGMVVSTGVGGGLVLDGKPYAGRTGNAGHVGHVVVDPHGVQCCCGGRGCLETVASGPHLVAWAREQGWAAPPDYTAKELAEAAVRGDAVAMQTFQRAAAGLAAGIASVAATCDLDLVVIGGGVANAGSLLFDPLRATLREYATLDFISGLRVVPAALGGEAGLVGAAALLNGDE